MHLPVGRYVNILLLGLIVTLLIIVYYPVAIDFNVYNPFWNGYDKLTRILNATLVNGDYDTILPVKPEGYMLILIPYKPLTVDDLNAILRFVGNGGVLLLMDDFGYGNMVLEAMNAPLRFKRGVLIDPLYYYKCTRIVRIRSFYGVLTGLSEVYLNYASVLEVRDESRVRVLALSSYFSFLDEDFDGVYDPGELYGPLVVAAEFSYGRGRVIVISDPSIGINIMLDYGDNLKLLLKLCSGFNILVDQKYTPKNLHTLAKESVISILSLISRKPILTPLILIVAVSISYLIGRRFGVRL